MTTRPTWSAWFENNPTPQPNQQAPPLPTSTLQPDQYQSSNSHNSYYQTEYDDRPRSYFPTNDQYSFKGYEDDQTNSIPLRSQTPQSVHSSLPYRADSYYGSHADDDSSISHVHESSRPFIQSPDVSAQENYYRNGPNMDDSLSPPRGSSTVPGRSSSSTPSNILPPPIVVVQGAALTSGDKAMLNPDVQKQMQNRRSWRPWFSWSTALIMTAVLIWELYQNQFFTGNIIETGKGGQAFNIMIGPSAPVLIHVGARFVPCMRPTAFTNGNFICLNATDLVSSNGTTGDHDQICSLESWCGFNGFPNGVPNQWFRFITPIFIHGGVVHLLMNMIMQLRIGAQLERDMGPFRFAIIYMTSGIMGFIFGGNFAPRKQTSMGASGALFGLIGCLLIDLILNWRLIIKPGWELAKLLILVIISFAIGLLQWFDNFSHIGGFFTGILTGILFIPAIHFSRGHRVRIWIARAIALPLLVVLIVLGITNFENNSDPGASCSWCRYFSCLPINGWCDAFNESP